MKRFLTIGVCVLLCVGCTHQGGGNTGTSSSSETVVTTTTPVTTTPVSTTSKKVSVNETKNVLQAVLDNKKTFVSPNNMATYLYDYKIFDGNVDVTEIEYVFVDFNKDKQTELVLLLNSPIDREFLVLHYNGYDVYGYKFINRGMISLKQDGSFTQSNGAGSNTYATLSFKDNECVTTKEAVKDSVIGIYELNGVNVSTETLNDFINDWNLKKDVVWSKLNYTPSSNNNNVVISSPESSLGQIYIKEEKDDKVVYVNHKEGQYSFKLPIKAQNVIQTDSKLEFILQNEFSKVKYTFEIVEDINSAPEAELKIKEITDALPYTLSKEQNPRQIIDLFEQYFDDKDINSNHIWYDVVSENGVAYFYESSTYTNQDNLVYDRMIAESYTYQGEVAIRETIEIIEFLFLDYYMSLETRIEKNDIENRFLECVIPVFDEPHMTKAFKGIKDCLWYTVIVKAE